MKIALSNMFDDIQQSSTLAINEKVKELRLKGENIYHLGFGESPFPVQGTVKEGLRKGENVKSYLPTQGILELREQVSKFYQYWFNLNCSPDNIFIGPGSKELIFDLLLLIEGDLILPVPSWVSYIPQAKLARKSAIKVNTSFENNYCMTAEELDKAYNQAIKNNLNPKILLINTPGNPCGNSYNASLVKDIANFAQSKNLFIISDEIYSNIIFEGYKHTSFAEYYPEGTFITGGISKDRSLGGYRLGVCIIPADQNDFRKAFNTLISETFSCVSAPIQYAGINAYSTDSGITDYIKNCTSIHNIVLNQFFNIIIKSDFIDCSPPMGAFYLYPRFKLNDISTSDELASILLEKYNVATLPGSCFGHDPKELNLRLAITDYSGEEIYEYFIKNKSVDPAYLFKNYCPNLFEAANLILKMTEQES